MKSHFTPDSSRPSVALRAPLLFLGVLGVAALGGCGGGTADSSEEVVGKAESALTCVTIQNLGPTTTLVDDAAISTDPTDPTKANTNYGAVTPLTVGYVGTEYRRVLMKFDPLGAAIPSDAVVGSASLRLRMTQSLGKSPVDVYAGTAVWDEHTTKWNQIAAAPNGGIGGLQATLVTLGVANNSYVDIPLPPALIESWLDPSSNYGIVLDHPLTGRTTFGASEAAPASRPTLQVCYDPASCSDERQNHGETGVDCGGPCPTICCADIPETCNGIDDNCNGAIDENVTQACSTACGGGIETCAAGAWSACSSEPQPEVCNLIDDDCNGACDGAQCQVAIHRYGSGSFEHLTTDAAEVAANGGIHVYDAFHLYPSQAAGTVPFYHCDWNVGSLGIPLAIPFYTTDPGCIDPLHIAGNSLTTTVTLAGVLGYINLAPTCGSRPLHLLFNTQGAVRIYTADEAERTFVLSNPPGYWTDGGIIGYVW